MIEYTTLTGHFPPQFDWESRGYQNYEGTIIIPYKDGDEYKYTELAMQNDAGSQYDYLFTELLWGIAKIDGVNWLCVRSPDTNRSMIINPYGSATYAQDGTIISSSPVGGFTGAQIRADRYSYIFQLGGTDIDITTQNYLNSIGNLGIRITDIIPEGSLIYDVGSQAFRKETGAVTLISEGVSFNGIPMEEDVPSYGETSTYGGGVGGSFDNSSDAVDFSSLPTGGGASASGLVTMFHPTASQMADFGAFLWGGLFNQGFDGLLTSLKKWVNDPIESIIQLSVFPVTPPTGSSTLVKFCGISSALVGDGVYMNKITDQFMTFDFGSITVPAYWKQALDYTPYSKVSIYLPFCGIQPLNADDIIDATLHLKYNIDLLTGIFSAELKVSKIINGTNLNSVLYNWSGNMSTQIPITASNFSQVFGSLMSAVAGVGIGAISGGLGAAAGGTEAAAQMSVRAGAITGAGHGLASNIGNVINSKPHVQHSGRLDGSAGALSNFTPYLIIERPVQSLSAKFQSEQGYPSNVVQTLKNLSGMTVCEAPILDGINCTDDEKTMINNLLCGGVII